MSYIEKPSMTIKPSRPVTEKLRQVHSECSHNYRIVKTDYMIAYYNTEFEEIEHDILFYCTKCLKLERKVKTLKGV